MQVSRYWFRDPSSHVASGPFRRTATLCLEVFPSTPSRRTLKVPGRSIHGVAPPSEYDRRGRPRFLHGMPRGASHEVSGSSSTYQLSSPLTPGLTSPRYVPSPGFFTLSTACSSTACPALFHAGSAHGVPCPSELSPRPEPWCLSTPRAFLPFTATTFRRPT